VVYGGFAQQGRHHHAHPVRSPVGQEDRVGVHGPGRHSIALLDERRYLFPDLKGKQYVCRRRDTKGRMMRGKRRD